MKTLSKMAGLTITAVVLAIQQTAALAQQAQEIDIAYSPLATPIPTLSQWALLGLSLLLAAIAIYALRNKAGGKPLASVILVFAVTLGGLSGRNLISEVGAAVAWSAECSSFTDCTMSNAAGGIVHACSQACTNTVTVTNTSGITQRVASVSYLGGATVGVPGSGTRCVASMVLAQGAACTVKGGGEVNPTVSLKTVTVNVSATQPQPGAVPTVITAVTHNLHSDPNAFNAVAGRAALLDLNEDYLMIASHDYSGLGAPNSAPGVWNFGPLDGMVNLLTEPGLKGTLAFNPIRSPAYMSMVTTVNGIPTTTGHRPINNAQFGAYCANLVKYYNTAAGFTDGATTYTRTPVHIKYWELWGEANINEFMEDNREPETFDLMSPVQKDAYLSTPVLYRAMYDAAAPLMKAADPNILIGGPGVTGVDVPFFNAMAYINELLLTTQPLDFVSYHDYGNFDRATSDQGAFLVASNQLLPFAQQVQTAITASTLHPNARIFISEGNGNGGAYVAPVDNRAHNIFDVAYLASLLRGYVLLGVDAYERFELMSPTYPVDVVSAVDSAGTRSPAYYGWKLLNQQLTRTAPIRQSQVTDPAPVSGQSTVDSLAFQSSANTLTVLLINKTVQNASDNSSQTPGVVGATVTANVAVTGRTIASATLSRVDSLSQTGIDTQPVVVTGGGTTLSVPLRGYGITFVVLTLN